MKKTLFILLSILLTGVNSFQALSWEKVQESAAEQTLRFIRHELWNKEDRHSKAEELEVIEELSVALEKYEATVEHSDY